LSAQQWETSATKGSLIPREARLRRLFIRAFEGKKGQRDKERKLIIDAYCQDRWSDALERNIFRAYEQIPLHQEDNAMPTVLPRSATLMRTNGTRHIRGRRGLSSSAFLVFVPFILVLLTALILIGNGQISFTSLAAILQTMADTNL